MFDFFRKLYLGFLLGLSGMGILILLGCLGSILNGFFPLT
jgi:hypothetical protein